MLNIEKMLSDVEEFHKSVLLLPTPSEPTLLARHRHEFAMKFLREEINEFDQAYNQNDLPEAADALIDLIYVALGRLIEMGIAPGPIFNEVHKKNMLKFKGRTKRGHDTDAIKPEGWTPPDHSWLLLMDENDVENIKARHLEVPYIEGTEKPKEHITYKRSPHSLRPDPFPPIAEADKKDPLAKPQTALIPYEALVVEADAAAYGAYVKYTPWNWLDGRPYTQVLSSIDHHLRAWSEHERNDPESGCHHLGHARIDIAFLIVWEARMLKQCDDRRPAHTITYHTPDPSKELLP